MNHNDVARVRDLPARRLDPRPLGRPLGCDSADPVAETAPRCLVRPHDSRPLVRTIEGGR
ncbi:hypothetical protein [Kitasatospora viridis]|uniref:Uncharacterized protein n=1 Tax=Kitasatospora viridis TaxID=281105 RepID=A0A561UIC7_9ACTN|nr:hypothetical protein [Kitasatospora viridis]TWF99128.1 hypothetical protein FHX73_112967 [Kitasatospora viridis]